MNKDNLAHARAHYNVRHWSQGYFGINDAGNVYVAPKFERQDHTVDLINIAKMIEDKGLTLPALVRFPQIIHHRIHSLCEAFNKAIEDYDYQEKYLLVYPINSVKLLMKFWRAKIIKNPHNLASKQAVKQNY
jgi:arginine decarboxylase